MEARVRLSLPRPTHVELRGFSLYTQRTHISESISTGVFCLAGANGLGKSTFLSALNFGMTGIVTPESLKFNSLAQYLSRCIAYTRTYFDGRISERDRDSAEVTVEFTAGTNTYRVTRHAFDTEGLRGLVIKESETGDLVYDEQDESDESRQDAYRRQIVEDIGLASFAQFAFLQHYLLTFDEHRRMLFWDTQNTEKLLYLVLGLDPDDADRADELRKRANGEDSLARNAQYDATVARGRLNDLRLVAGESERALAEVEVGETLDTAQEERDEAVEALEAVLGMLADARLEMAAASAEEMRAREEYERQFTLRMSSTAPTGAPAAIAEMLRTGRCTICVHEVRDASEIMAKVEANSCPLCGSELAPHNPEPAPTAAALEASDRVLGDSADRLRDTRAKVQRLENDVEGARTLLQGRTAALSAIEKHATPRRSDQGSMKVGLDRLEDQFRATITDALSRKDEHLERRDSALFQLKPLRSALVAAYSEAELELVPAFQELATQFLGMPLDITLAPSGNERVRLLLSVKNERRRGGNQLSESQRYFLDIALRMALIRHMSSVKAPAPLYVDTPEGSLDIAYESRAGAMFAAFASQGHQLIMTANINTSQLLLRLAEECGPNKMKLVRMTSWTSLSDVQAAEEHRIESAYLAIETALAEGRSTDTVAELIGRAHD